MTALPSQVQCYIKEPCCTVSRNCSLRWHFLQKFERTEQILNGHELWMHIMTASPLHNSMLHQGSHTTTTRRETQKRENTFSSIQILPWPPVSWLQHEREGCCKTIQNIHLNRHCVHQSPQLVRHANTHSLKFSIETTAEEWNKRLHVQQYNIIYLVTESSQFY